MFDLHSPSGQKHKIHDDVATCLPEVLLNVPHDLIFKDFPTYCVIQKHTTLPIFKVQFGAMPAWGNKIKPFALLPSLLNVCYGSSCFELSLPYTVQQGRYHFPLTLNCHLNPVSHCWHTLSSGLFNLFLSHCFSLFFFHLVHIMFLHNLTCTLMGAMTRLSRCNNNG